VISLQANIAPLHARETRDFVAKSMATSVANHATLLAKNGYQKTSVTMATIVAPHSGGFWATKTGISMSG
jgi:hypothetical protein